MKNNKTTIRILEPKKGGWLTQKISPKNLYECILSKKIYLAINDSPENWKEITIEEADKIKSEKEKIFNERMEKMKLENDLKQEEFLQKH